METHRVKGQKELNVKKISFFESEVAKSDFSSGAESENITDLGKRGFEQKGLCSGVLKTT